MSKKILIVASIVKTHIMQFHIPTFKMLKDIGYEVHVCAKNDYEEVLQCQIPFCDKYINISFNRSPLSIKNFKAYRHLKELIIKEKYNVVHCHTPVPSVLTRLAIKNIKQKPKLIYTAHGFHFYKGASLKNWLIFYPIEKYLSKYTNVLITINQEDYNIAKDKFRAKNTKLINGVGTNLGKFKPLSAYEKLQLREKLSFQTNNFIIIYVAELVKNKRQEDLIKAVQQIKNKKLKLSLIGQGKEYFNYTKFIKDDNLDKRVRLLGYQNNINEWLNIADLYVSSSQREGLPVFASDCRVWCFELC